MAATPSSEAKSGLKLISPPVFYAILMLAAPLATVLVYSVMTGEKGAVSLPLTLDNYYELFTKPIYRALMWRSLMVSFFVTAATVLLAYPVAYFVSFHVSPVRAFRAVGGTPRFIARGEGAYLWDAEGQKYIDYIGSWGPMILGHGHPAVLDAVLKAARDGFSFGAPTEREVELAEEIIRHVPSIEQVRLVSSGTEAAMSASRGAERTPLPSRSTTRPTRRTSPPCAHAPLAAARRSPRAVSTRCAPG